LLIIVNVLTNIAWVVFMMRFFFDDIPIDIDESALIDGASWFGAFWRVVVPLVMTGLWVIFMTWQIRQQRAACTSDLT
jgi:multiple sugar transport system permease protein